MSYVAMQRQKRRINDGEKPPVWTTYLENMPDIVIDSGGSEQVVMDPGYLSDVGHIVLVDV